MRSRRALEALALIGSLAAAAPPMATAQAAPSPAEAIFVGARPATSRGAIDEAVFARAKQLGLPLARDCSDAVFLRRVTVDLTGTLPTAAEARRFLDDRSPDKRGALVRDLLGRETFADCWASKWGDLLRIKAEFPINLWPDAASAYHRWVRTAIRDGMPYDRFARELLTASGSNFRVPQVNFYRAVQSREPSALARAAALTFMGVRAEAWPPERLEGLAVFFSRVGFKRTREWKEEIVTFDAIAAAEEGPREGVLPDGTRVTLAAGVDPREAFADWLIRPDNPWFARSVANRVWSWLLGRGVIHEPDDLRPDNPPSNPALLAVLERTLVEAKFDLRALFEAIASSQTYQLASVPAGDAPEAEAEFTCYPVRRLPAEVLIDALCQVTGSTERYASMIPEPYTIVPKEQRSITLPDGSITSSFLELFGRPARDTGLESERSDRFTAAQRLHLLNSTHVRQKIEKSGLVRRLAKLARKDPRRAATTLYLTVLSRRPTPAERAVVRDYAQNAEGRGGVLVDLVWALVNSPEFLFRH